jgi:hypothetical protein
MRLLLQLIRGWRGLAPAAPHKDQQQRQHQEEQQQEQASTLHGEGAHEGFNSCSSHLDNSNKDVAVGGNLAGISSSRPCVPTLVQLRVSADQEGMAYGALFHQLLATRNILLLGLYRPVQHQSARFDCVLTNPPQVGRLGLAGGFCGHRLTFHTMLAQQLDVQAGSSRVCWWCACSCQRGLAGWSCPHQSIVDHMAMAWQNT